MISRDNIICLQTEKITNIDTPYRLNEKQHPIQYSRSSVASQYF